MSELFLNLNSGGRIRVVRDPARTLEPAEVEDLMPQWVAITRSAFENELIPESDVRIHALEVRYGAYLRVDGQEVAFTSADILSPPSLEAPALYLEGTALHRDWQGRQLYWPLIACRLAIGKALGCGFITTRTPNPRVCRSLRRFEPYPIFDQRPAFAAAAGEIASELYEHHSDYQRDGGCLFDLATGIQKNAYAGRMNKTLPEPGDPRIDKWFGDHVDVDAGDAMILVSELREDACDPHTERAFGLSFPDLVNRVRAVVS